jgi:hypothetical protein
LSRRRRRRRRRVEVEVEVEVRVKVEEPKRKCQLHFPVQGGKCNYLRKEGEYGKERPWKLYKEFVPVP